MNSADIIKILKSHANPKNLEGMARFKIGGANTLGISIPVLRAMAKKAGKDHKTALELWDSGIHEARILASMTDEPDKVTAKQMDDWTGDFDSWDLCDQVCMNLFGKTKLADSKIMEYSMREEEFVKRTAFSLIAVMAWQKKGAKDPEILKYLPLIKKASADERNFVKKAVNWALRQIGKSNPSRGNAAVKLAKEMMKSESKSARWIASDALREFEKKGIR